MPAEKQLFEWDELDTVPKLGGVYAWYARLRIGKADVNEIIAKVQAANKFGGTEAVKIVEDALDRFVFRPYQEMPYKVQLTGQLKPKYSGQTYHEPSKPSTLVARLAEHPERLAKIADVLQLAAPAFTAPLYIGMAADLWDRIGQHKQKIVEMRDTGIGRTYSMEDTDAGFANQVVTRGFEPNNLFVQIAPVEIEFSEHNDVENILNRINFPIFGRN